MIPSEMRLGGRVMGLVWEARAVLVRLRYLGAKRFERIAYAASMSHNWTRHKTNEHKDWQNTLPAEPMV
jgi:hypothetical protein